MSRIDDVAKLAGVSIATVSRVLNKTANVSSTVERRVLKAVDELSYRPNKFARGLAGSSSDSIGVMVPDLSETFFGTLIKGVESVAMAHDMQVAVASGNRNSEDSKRAFEWLRRHSCDAQIIFNWSNNFQEVQAMVADTATVVMGLYVPELSDSCIYLNEELGGALATEHLIEYGHRSIAHILYPVAVAMSSRTYGYRQALDRANLAFDPDLLVMADGFDEESGYQATERLLSRGHRFTAIFAANDQLAAGALAALRNNGLSIPEDVSVIGFNNSTFTQFLWPPLTTVHQPILEMAQSACLLAIALLKGNSTKEVKRKFEPTLVKRASVARVKN